MIIDTGQVRQLPVNMIPLSVRSSLPKYSDDDSLIDFYRKVCPKESVIPVGDRIIALRHPYMRWFLCDKDDVNIYNELEFSRAMDAKDYKPLQTIGMIANNSITQESKGFVFWRSNITCVGSYEDHNDPQKNTKDKLLFVFPVDYPTVNYLLISFLCFKHSSNLPIPKSQKPDGFRSSQIANKDPQRIFDVDRDYCVTSFLYNHFPKLSSLSGGRLQYQMDKDMLGSNRFLPGEEFYHMIYPSPVQAIGAFEAQTEYPFVNCGGWIETRHWIGGTIVDDKDSSKHIYKVRVKGIELTLETIDFFEYKKGDYVIILKKSSRFSKMFSNMDGWYYVAPTKDTALTLIDQQLVIAPFWMQGRY